jgi:hypothetical protein
LIHGTGVIFREEGFSGIYRGLFPVVRNRTLDCGVRLPILAQTMRQMANSGVRFSSYSLFKVRLLHRL